MAGIAFHGGTCLRFLFSIPRYSEDLDFALERPSAPYDFRQLVGRIQRDLTAEAYGVDCRIQDAHHVHSAFIRFPGLLHELGLSAQRTEAASIKIEVDTRPPPGARCETTLVRRHVVANLFHHDRASLLAGKLHAVLQRPRGEGARPVRPCLVPRRPVVAGPQPPDAFECFGAIRLEGSAGAARQLAESCPCEALAGGLEAGGGRRAALPGAAGGARAADARELLPTARGRSLTQAP